MAPLIRRTAPDLLARQALLRALSSTIAALFTSQSMAAEGAPGAPPEASMDLGPTGDSHETQPVEDNGWRTSVSLRAPTSCATLEAFELGIRRRAPRLDLVDDPTAPRRVQGTIRRVGGDRPFVATLVIERPEEPPLRRTIRAESCEEALDALAFMTAVALDPQEASAEPEPPVSEEPPAEEPTPVHVEPRPALDGWTPFLGAGLHVAWAAAPSPLLGPELIGGFQANTDSVLSPAVRLTAARAARAGFQQAGGTAHFTLTTTSFELCPFRIAASQLSLQPCGFVTAGMLLAEGTDTLEPRRVWRPWFVPGGSLIAAWKPFTPVRLTLTGRLGRPLVRDAFEFAPETFHEVLGWAASAGGAAEVELP